MTWEKFTKGKNGGGVKTLGSLSGHAKVPVLLIGALLRERGFDVTRRYEMLFNRDALAIGLQESTSTNAFKVGRQAQTARARQSEIYVMRAVGFCREFGLNKRYTVERVERQDDGLWVLYLTEINI